MTNWVVGDCSSRRELRQLQLGCMCSLYWEYFPVPMEAGTGMWGKGLPWQPILVCHLTMVPHFQGSSASSRSIPHSNPLRLCAANSNPFPGSALITPCFNTQPLPDWQTPMSGCGMQGCGIDHLCKSLSVLLATNQPLHFLPIAPKSSDDVSSQV